jgi:tRNA A-37 threonylcarbamoyl transferase component Bud32
MINNIYIKGNVKEEEYEMHRHIYRLNIVKTPRIIAYDRKTEVMVMDRIDYMNISDFYGEEEENISPALFTKVRSVVQTLYENNIVYPDITGYNFIEYKDTIWVIDFEHARFKPHLKDAFVERFVHDPDYNKWNPEFK